MKKVIILLIAAVACINPMCSGAMVECSETEIFNEDVPKGSFTALYDVKQSSLDHIKIVIISESSMKEKKLDPKNSKQVTVNDTLMMQTYPVNILEPSRVIVSLVHCWYEY